MEEINFKGISIVNLYLEKLEILNGREREVLIKTIDILNNPLFITGKKISDEDLEKLGII